MTTIFREAAQDNDEPNPYFSPSRDLLIYVDGVEYAPFARANVADVLDSLEKLHTRAVNKVSRESNLDVRDFKQKMCQAMGKLQTQIKLSAGTNDYIRDRVEYMQKYWGAAEVSFPSVHVGVLKYSPFEWNNPQFVRSNIRTIRELTRDPCDAEYDKEELLRFLLAARDRICVFEGGNGKFVPKSPEMHEIYRDLTVIAANTDLWKPFMEDTESVRPAYMFCARRGLTIEGAHFTQNTPIGHGPFLEQVKFWDGRVRRASQALYAWVHLISEVEFLFDYVLSTDVKRMTSDEADTREQALCILEELKTFVHEKVDGSALSANETLRETFYKYYQLQTPDEQKFIDRELYRISSLSDSSEYIV